MLQFDDSGWTVFPGEIGPVGLAWTPQGVCRVEFGVGDAAAVAALLAERCPRLERRARPGAAVRTAVRGVQSLLRGRPVTLAEIPVDYGRASAFSRRVWQELRRVPPGETVTYGELARRAGRPGAARAIGRIMGANPVPLIVPCHRCLGADGALVGFSNAGGVRLKARILDLEGHEFDTGHARAAAHLRRRDPVLRPVIRQVGPFLPHLERRLPAWDTLVQAIIHQQLSVKAGRTIADRVRALTPGPRFPAPTELLALDPALLRAAGLSHAKVAYVRDLAERLGDGRLRPGRLARLDDEAAIGELMQVKGIGRWSAQMHLIFHLDRLDVLPVGDVGLLAAAGRLYGLSGPATAAQLTTLAEPWRPYRSVASWYLWQSLDLGGL